MVDSEFSASELRMRYHRGGTVPDDQLSSAQLRARHAIPANSKDFSTADKDGQTTSNQAFLIILVITPSPITSTDRMNWRNALQTTNSSDSMEPCIPWFVRWTKVYIFDTLRVRSNQREGYVYGLTD
eukprot:scaffold510_cov179-Ochromonas_danica.AAC.2